MTVSDWLCTHFFLPLEGEVSNICFLTGMFDRHRHQIALRVEIEGDIFRNFPGLSNFLICKFDQSSVSVFEVVDFHDLSFL